MRVHLITNDKNLALGLRFCGVSNEIVFDEQNLKKALNSAISDAEIGIILINASLFAICEEHIMRLKLLSRRRIILKIPDISDVGSFENSISARIKKVLGGGSGA